MAKSRPYRACFGERRKRNDVDPHLAPTSTPAHMPLAPLSARAERRAAARHAAREGVGPHTSSRAPTP